MHCMPSSDKPFLHWSTLRFFPELRYIKNPEQLKQLNQAYRRAPGRLARVIKYLSLCIGVIVIIAVPVGLGAKQLGLSPGIMGAIQGGMIGLVMPLTANHILRHPYRRFIRQFLQEQGVPVCLNCGYDLRGQTEPRCSACGEVFDTRLLKYEAFEAD